MKLCISTTCADAEPYLETFIAYHLSIGFDYIFLFFDNPEEKYIGKYLGKRGIVVIKNDKMLNRQWKRTPGFKKLSQFTDKDLIARQILNTNVALEMARRRKINWLLHIDVDEIFYPVGQDARAHFRAMSSGKVDVISYVNHEAIPEKMETTDIFKSVTLFKKNALVLNRQQRELVGQYAVSGIEYFNFYANGKAAARVCRGVRSIGPHFFSFRKNFFQRIFPRRTQVRRYSDPCILHYACCSFDIFYRKYKVLGSFPDKWLNKDEIRGLLPIHAASRDICLGKDISLARKFYEMHFLNSPFKDRAMFVDRGICFEVSPFSIQAAGDAPKT